VQTAISAFVYFNYFLLSTPINELIEKFKAVSREALDAVMEHTDAQFKSHADRANNVEYTKIDLKTQVLSYSELYEAAKRKSGGVDALIASVTQKGLAENMDRRELCLSIVEELCVLSEINIPTVVVFISPPYCPRNTMNEGDPSEQRLWETIKGVLDRKAEEKGAEYKLLHFFSGLSDSSYLKIDDDAESVRCLKENFPDFKTIYNVPIDLIQEMNIPAFTFGVLGKDAHKWTERLNMPYSFGDLPGIIMEAVESVLGKNE
jgi:arginine utilization protein RocB